MIDNIVKNYRVINGIQEEFLNKVKLLYIFRSNEVLVSTINDEFYTVGRNEFGCLGTGNDEALAEPTKIDELCGNRIIDIAAGRYHMMALTETGKIYTWGQNNCAQLGQEEIDQDFHKPIIVNELIQENIIAICCGHSHSLALNDKGEVFAWGLNEWGEVGSGKEDIYQVKPIKLKGFGKDKVKVIACGLHHSLALTEKGKVYTWGSGWLRKNNISDPKIPKIVRVSVGSRDVAIKNIACAQEHCLLLSVHNDIYAFGKNTWDLNENFISEYVPYQNIVKLENYFENISYWKFAEIAASPQCDLTIGLLFDGTFVVWGDFNECNELFPRTTKLKSFQDIFAAYSEEKFTYRPIIFNELVIPNEPTDDENYVSEFEEISTLQSGKYGIVCKAKNIYENSEVYAMKKIPIEYNVLKKSLKIIKNLSLLNPNYVVNYKKVWIEENYFNKDDTFIEDMETSSQYTKVLKLGGSHLIHIQMELCFGTLGIAIDQLKKEIDPESSEVVNELNYFILCELFIEILEALNYLHKQPEPITHRYLDPDEILITHGLNGKFIKIADFSSKLIHANHHEDVIPRKVYRYIAPEIMDFLDYENARNYDTRADIYSLGKIVNEMFHHYISEYISTDENDNSRSSITSFSSKTLKLFKIVKDMLQPYAKFRPDCEKIQEQKNMWSTGIKEVEDMAQFNKYMDKASKVWEIQDSFHLYFLKKKIESSNINQNKTERRISLLIDFRKDDKYKNEFNENQVIGYGAFGIVCEVQEKLSKDNFAIKMIPIEQNYKQSSIREIVIMTKLNYNFVVKCKSIWIEDHYDLYENHMKNYKSNGSLAHNQRIEKPFLLFIQMELCFQTLKQAIEKVNNETKQAIYRKMTPVGYYVACELMIELLEGVDYLHKLVPAVIHRDLKPSNILISFGTNGRFVKIADFGLSTLHENDDQSHTAGLGTRHYMAPEVETKKYDTRCDIYSLGYIVYDVFNFEFKNVATSYHRVLNDKYENLQEIRQTMICKEFTKRPSCESILKSAFKWRLNIEEIMHEPYFSIYKSDPPESIEANLSRFIICKKLEHLKKE